MNIMMNDTAYMPIAAPDLVTMELYIRRSDGLMYKQQKADAVIVEMAEKNVDTSSRWAER